MKPIGILMREHRIIERMLTVLERERAMMKNTGRFNMDVLTEGVEFFRMYGDKIHHGKEEDILFREMDAKPLSIEHRRIMSQLIDEHTQIRMIIRTMDTAREHYNRNNHEQLLEIETIYESLQSMYAKHVELEEKHFFYPAMEYFSDDEQQDMIAQFYDYDSKTMKEKYEAMVKHFENEKPVLIKDV